MAAREAARAAARFEDWWAQDWIQRRWKTAKQREEQDQVGSVGLIRSRHMRHERAPQERLDLYQVLMLRGGLVTGEFEVGFKDGGEVSELVLAGTGAGVGI